jgi:hypothetical protein
VPVPFAAVFQPMNVYPGLTIVPTVGRSPRGIDEIEFVNTCEVFAVALVLDVAGEPEAPFGSYVIVAVHLAYKVVLPVDV